MYKVADDDNGGDCSVLKKERWRRNRGERVREKRKTHHWMFVLSIMSFNDLDNINRRLII